MRNTALTTSFELLTPRKPQLFLIAIAIAIAITIDKRYTFRKYHIMFASMSKIRKLTTPHILSIAGYLYLA